jgi:hypothetical protein
VITGSSVGNAVTRNLEHSAVSLIRVVQKEQERSWGVVGRMLRKSGDSDGSQPQARQADKQRANGRKPARKPRVPGGAATQRAFSASNGATPAAKNNAVGAKRKDTSSDEGLGLQQDVKQAANAGLFSLFDRLK